MSASNLLARATTLLSRRAGVAGALLLTPVAALEAQTVFTPVSSGFYTTTSGMPDYAGSFGAGISASVLEGGAGMSLQGDSGVRSRDSFSYLADGRDGPEVRYRDGLTFAWRGTFSGSLVGPHYAGENWVEGDRLAVDYDFTVERTYAGSSIDWEVRFVFDGSDQGVASGSLSGDELMFNVSGSAFGSNPFTWSGTPTDYVDTVWTMFLVVKPSASALEDNWGVDDTLRVWMPEGSIEFGINSVPSAIPEPSTWALIMGATTIGVVMIRRRASRRN